MEITVFRDADKIKEGQLFIARKDSVEGRDKVILTQTNDGDILEYFRINFPHQYHQAKLELETGVKSW